VDLILYLVTDRQKSNKVLSLWIRFWLNSVIKLASIKGWWYWRDVEWM